MAKNMRVHELAKELGMTNGEAVDLALTLGVPVKSHSSSLNEAYADMIRRHAVRDGLTRPEQPEEAKPAKKGGGEEVGGHIVDRRSHAGRRVVTDRGGAPAPASTETAPPERTIAEPPAVEPVEADRDVAPAPRRPPRPSRLPPSRRPRSRLPPSHPPRPPPSRPRRWPTCPRRPRSPNRSSRRPPPRPSRRPPPRPSASPPSASRSCASRPSPPSPAEVATSPT